MSWPVVGGLTVVYWVLLFVRMRIRGRREFDRAFDRAAAAHPGSESFDVVVSTEVRPLRAAIVVFAIPIALVALHFVLGR